MTVCNMSIEGGARAGLIAPDEKAFEFLKGRPKSPKGAFDIGTLALRYWENAALRRRLRISIMSRACSMRQNCRRS